jgi:hypothetical protein
LVRELTLLGLKLCHELTRFEDPSFCDDPGNEFGRCDVEGGIVDSHTFGCDGVAAMDTRHF